MQIAKRGEFLKADGRVIYGWALVCEERGADGEWHEYRDTQGDHIPESVALDAALDFAKNSRVGKDMHSGEQVGSVPMVFMLTRGSSALGIESTKTGMLIGWEPNDPALLAAVASGERTGFSIGGEILESEEGVVKFAKADDGEPAPDKTRIFRRFRIDEISLVDRPAMEGATIAYVKRDARNSTPTTATAKVNAMDEEAYKAKIAELEAKLAEMTAPAEKAEPTVEQLLAEIEQLKAQIAEPAAKAEPVEDVAKAADPIVATLPDGTIVRKSDGPIAAKMAESLAKAHEAIALERTARADQDLEKRATETLANLGGDIGIRKALLKAADGIPGALAVLKGADAAFASLKVAPGVGGQGEPTVEVPLAKFNTARDAFAKAAGKTAAAATLDFLRTPEGAELYAATLPQATK